jgi:hypothetical protein
MGNLCENSGPVPGDIVGAGGAPMVQIDQNLPSVFNDRVIAPAVDMNDRSNPAGVMFPAGFIQTLIRISH